MIEDILSRDCTFLACDLDDTLIPGRKPLSPQAMPLFREIAKDPKIVLAYNSGRSLSSMAGAIIEYDLPVPNMLIGNVGTELQVNTQGQFLPFSPWEERFEGIWNGHSVESIHRAIDADYLQMLHSSHAKRNLSYIISDEFEQERVREEVVAKLAELGIFDPAIVFNIDVFNKKSYLELLPPNFSKGNAIDFIVSHFGLEPKRVLAAGDGWNDTEALLGHQSVLVNNASNEYKAYLRRLVEAKQLEDKVYFAKGDYLSMNGNYVAGIIEGMDHFNLL